LRTAAIPGAGDVRGNFLIQLEAKLSSARTAPNKYRDASQPQKECGHPAGLRPTTLPLPSITCEYACRCFASALVVIAIERIAATKIVDILNKETPRVRSGLLPQDRFLQ